MKPNSKETEDLAQLNTSGCQGPWNEGNLANLDEWRANMTTALMAMTAPHSAYAPACYWHCNSESEEFFTSCSRTAVTSPV